MDRKFFLYSGCVMIICMLGIIPVANAQKTADKPTMGAPKVTAKISSGARSVDKITADVSFVTSGATMYELSKQRQTLIKTIVDGYDKDGENLQDSKIVKKINADIEKLMPLTPVGSLEIRSAKDLSETAKKKMELLHGQEDYTQTLNAEAEKKYPMINLRQKVTVEYNKGPKHFRVSGTLYRITGIAVTIDDTIIDFVDLSDEERAKFDKQWNKFLRDQYVETHRALLIRKRAEETQTIYDQLKFELFKKNEKAGFIYLPESDNWTNAREYTKIYIDTLLKKKAAEKEATEKAQAQQNAQQKAQDKEKTAKTEEDDDDQAAAKSKNQAKESETTGKDLEAADAHQVTIEDTEENQEQYKEVKNKFEEGMKELAEASGIDAYPAYKNALWGFDISDVRFSLWKEKEFKNIKSELGRDTIIGEGLELEEGGLEISAIDLVYDANALNKVVYNFKNASRTDFQNFKGALTEQYGNIKEDKNGNYLNSIFTGKQNPVLVVGEDEIKELREGLDRAKEQMEELQKAYDEADDATKEAAEAALNKAQSAVQSLEKKIQTSEKSAIGKEYKYIASRMEFRKNDKGSTVLPYMITWKGAKTTGTVYFYYDKQSDRVENIFFVKEVI